MHYQSIFIVRLPRDKLHYTRAASCAGFSLTSELVPNKSSIKLEMEFRWPGEVNSTTSTSCQPTLIIRRETDKKRLLAVMKYERDHKGDNLHARAFSSAVPDSGHYTVHSKAITALHNK